MKRIALAVIFTALAAPVGSTERAGFSPQRAGYDACIATYVAVTASAKAARWLAGACGREHLRGQPVSALDQCFKTTLVNAQNDTAATQLFRRCSQRRQAS